MASVQIRNKQKVIDIMCEEEKLGEMKFNPDDTRTYSRFIELIEMLTSNKRELGERSEVLDRAIEEFAPAENGSVNDEENSKEKDDGEKFDSLFGRRLESVDDFEGAAAIFDKMKKVTDITVGTWNAVCEGLDEIFGDGVCNIFTQGAIDPELLSPMIDSVMPYFKEARQKKAKPYLKNA